MNAANRARFTHIFRLNIERRSSTAKGVDESSKASSKKKPLRLQGEALKARVTLNTERMLADVVGRGLSISVLPIAIEIRRACERWFDIANDSLYGAGTYEQEFAKLKEEATLLSHATGVQYFLNTRYRLWTPEYTTIKVPPILLEKYMEEFYARLAGKLYSSLSRGTSEEDAPHIMAYADVMMDGELHPWMDACGRVSTALGMAIAQVCEITPPLFAPTKVGHYSTNHDIEAHTAYYQACIARADAEVT